tara:strand:+ start:314 stop:457 length:144 start_codon:yes stop_codon:yes gene_type:complete
MENRTDKQMIDILLDVTQRQQVIIESQMERINIAMDMFKEILESYEQ